MTAGPDVQRFNELKVGDKVTFTYYESTVYQLRKSGTAKTATESGAMVPGGKKLPGGTMARQTIQTVTVKSVDMSIPSITVTTSDGRTVTRKVEKKSDLEGVKAGDKIDITYYRSALDERRAAEVSGPAMRCSQHIAVVGAIVVALAPRVAGQKPGDVPVDFTANAEATTALAKATTTVRIHIDATRPIATGTSC